MKFIDSLKSQVIDGYSEKHHIIPKSMGGTDNKSNLIALTPRQHFVAHWMLWKAYGGNMGRAFFMMSNFGKYGKVSSKTYALAREDYSKQVVIQMAKKPNIPAFTPEHRAKLSQAKLGRKLSPQHRENVRLAVLGRKCSEETKMKISNTKRKFKKDLADGAELQDAEGNVIDGIAYLEELV
jgi:hypothetical protein